MIIYIYIYISETSFYLLIYKKLFCIIKYNVLVTLISGSLPKLIGSKILIFFGLSWINNHKSYLLVDGEDLVGNNFYRDCQLVGKYSIELMKKIINILMIEESNYHLIYLSLSMARKIY